MTLTVPSPQIRVSIGAPFFLDICQEHFEFEKKTGYTYVFSSRLCIYKGQEWQALLDLSGVCQCV